MKNILQNFKQCTLAAGVIFILTLILSSCTKGSNSSSTANQTTCAVSIIDASPDAPGLDLYITGTKLNVNAITLGSFYNYFTAYAGSQQYVFYRTGTSTVAARDTISLATGSHNTVILANSIATPDFIWLKDTYSKPDTGMISIRLVNASTDAGSVDLVDKTTGVSLVQGQGYKGASDFTTVKVNPTDSLQIVQSGTLTPLANVLPYALYKTQSVYTVWLCGFASQRLDAGIMQNATY